MSYHQMTDDEIWTFLDGRARPAILSTVRADGRPHSAPIWYEVQGRSIQFNTGADTVKGRNLARDGRVSVCVQDDVAPFSFVLLTGQVELRDDLDEVQAVAARIGGRYMGAERAEEYGERNGVPGELVVQLTPTKVSGAKDVAS